MVALQRLTKKPIGDHTQTNDQILKSTLNSRMNEKITEDIVRSHFKSDNLINEIKIDEQKPRNERIKELLKNASKRKEGKGVGKPEFIITFPEIIDSLIVIECKSELKDHQGKKNESSNPEKYAVDGVLHYADFLKKDFNVIAIAVSGTKPDEMKISQFYFKKNSKDPEILSDIKLLSIYDYLNIFEKNEISEKYKNTNLLKFSSALNKKLYNFSVPENERATIVSGILIALQDKSFRQSYQIYKFPSELVEDLLKAIERELNSKNLGSKSKILMGEYRKISQSNKLSISKNIRNSKTGKDEKNTLLRDIIYEIYTKVFPFVGSGYDLLGQFYSEFIKYVYGDKKLGLILTPYHITELFVEIANPNTNSVIYDSCCGTAGFLIRAMETLIELAGNDEDKKKRIREKQLIGIEERSDMFTYACSNMMMRGDGKSNIFSGDSSSQTEKEKIKKLKPTIGLLNPPYSTEVSELEFVYHNLECLENNGICVSIMPISCVTTDSGNDLIWKTNLLEKHTLEAVFSMPLELFQPAANTGTVIVVFKAHTPHPKNYETYFGLWKNDGLIKVKHLGRVDFNNTWNDIKQNWIDNYRSKKEIKEQYVKKIIQAEDEWCAEEYLETDYSNINDSDFITEITKFSIYKIQNKYTTEQNGKTK